MKEYDCNLFFEPGYGEMPKAYFYEMSFDGEWWNCNTQGNIIRYEFDEEDCNWILKTFGYSSIDDYWVDEWFSTGDKDLVELNFPPKLRMFVRGLPEYEPELTNLTT
jgi:hypothetical protein